MPWGRKPGAEPSSFDRFRDQGHTKIVCGVNGCRVTRSGPFAEAREKIAQHRREKHPDWTPPARPRRQPYKRRRPD